MKPSEDLYAFPSPGIATALTLGAYVVMIFVAAPLAAAGHGVAGLAAGMVLGFGGVGSLAARRVPAPAELRLGLCGFQPRLLLLVLMLVPLTFWLSELENIVAIWLERPEPASAVDSSSGGGSGLRTLEIMLFAVLLRPVIEEFFFRGVIQQGAVAHLGARGGLVWSTVLFALARSLTGPTHEYAAIVIIAQSLFEGAALGGLRLATGSLLPGILLQGLMNGVGLVALSVADDFPIQGFTTFDGHTNPALLAGSLLLIGWAALKMRRLHAGAPPLPPAPEP
ncbi:MAG: CPBP family intramembrane metalloprotease [bacterium]|nr:CPBP family intramembrane metalloprotease [bacterium]